MTIDELLSGDELLDLAEKEQEQNENRFRGLMFGMLDLSTILFFFLPLFRQKTDEAVLAVSLPALEMLPYLKVIYFAVVLAIIAVGALILALQNCSRFSERQRKSLSFAVSVTGLFLFILSPQPYAAAFLLVLLMIKALIVIKKH